MATFSTSRFNVKKTSSWATFIAALVLILITSRVECLDNGLARTPPMGWLSWERFTCNVDCDQYPDDCIRSKLYRDMAERLVQDGYAELGYEYVNIDDCWSELEREPLSGNLLSDSKRFPEGIKSLARTIHAKQLKLGIYGDCGTKTCAGYPAQLKSEQSLDDNYFDLDAKRLADWQVDSFKFDGCNLDPTKAESVCPRMAKALNATERPILIVCEWPFYMLREHYEFNRKLEPNFALAQEACNAWRYYEDVEDSWDSVLSIVDFTIRIQNIIVQYHGPGHWFDPDQLVIGNFALSLDQARAQMALWCVWSAPLYMSNDLRQIAPEMAEVLKNKKLIEVDQDPLGVFGLKVNVQAAGVGEDWTNKQFDAFVKPVEPIRNGCPSFVVVFLNRNTLGHTKWISFPLRKLLLGVPYKLVEQHYNQVYRLENSSVPSSSSGSPQLGAPLDGNKCYQLIEKAMTKDPSHGQLIVKSVDKSDTINIEHKQVYFEVDDLFDDEKGLRPIGLDGQLNLRVNPSGVRVVKLQQI